MYFQLLFHTLKTCASTHRYRSQTSRMQDGGVTFRSSLNLAARVDQGERRAVTDGHSVQKAYTFGQELEDVSQRQETEKDVVRINRHRIAERFQSGHDIFVREENAFRHSRRTRCVHNYSGIVILRRSAACS